MLEEFSILFVIISVRVLKILFMKPYSNSAVLQVFLITPSLLNSFSMTSPSSFIPSLHFTLFIPSPFWVRN